MDQNYNIDRKGKDGKVRRAGFFIFATRRRFGAWTPRKIHGNNAIGAVAPLPNRCYGGGVSSNCFSHTREGPCCER
jgi:hypothetical protein